jgi:hypothetical protein
MPPIGAAMAAAGLQVSETWVYWTRRIRVEDFLTDLRSHSYVASMPEAAADALLDRERGEILRVFPDGNMTIPMRVYPAVGVKSLTHRAVPTLTEPTGLQDLKHLAVGLTEGA